MNFKVSLDLIEKQNIEDDLFKIEPLFYLPPNYNPSHLELYIQSMEKLVQEIILDNDSKIDFDKKNLFLSLNQNLPLIKHSSLLKPPFCFTLSVLCLSDFTHGVGRFIPDLMNKWLIPGKPLAINGQRSLEFKFKKYPSKSYYIAQYFINITQEKELSLIKRNIAAFINEIKLIILAVQHARHIISIKRLSLEQKSIMIEDNISSLFDRDIKENSAFDQMKDFIFKLSQEKKLSQIKENIAYLMHKRPNTFDRDVFDSVHNVSLLFRGNFTALREEKHVSRIISLQYLFKKSIQQIVSGSSNKKRIIHLKLLKTNLQNSKNPILGILICMNLLHEKEYFEKSFILDGISHLIKDFRYVENSYIVDHRDEKLLSFYIEIERENSDFSLSEIKELKTRLKEEFKERMKSVINPIFLPRNEEEILRNIIVLSKQIRYVKDLPQVIIAYDKQTQKNVSFNVILLRLIKKNTSSIKDLFSYSQTFLKFYLDESKIVGVLKKKYPKEANIFRVSLNKFSFLRRDYSLDLRKARQAVAKELTKVIGEYRDFNGGMLIKQCEALEALKKLMPHLKKSNEFLLENFFYSIRPGIMQSILDQEIFKKFFLMFSSIIKQIKNQNYLIETKKDEKYFFVMIATPFKKHKEEIILAINKLKFKSFELISSSLDTNEIRTLGYILREDNEEERSLFHKTITSILKKY